MAATPPKLTTTFGYRSGSTQHDQVKIATSNLFIETASTPVDYMVGATFDGIGGNEFINTGDSAIILQQGKSLVQNSSDILELVSSSTNEKQADNEQSIMSQFALSLKNYLPDTVNNSEFVGRLDISGETGDVYESFPAKNVYFDSTYGYICIELKNLTDSEEVEVEFVTSDDPLSAII
jgi:hypothetical protein